MLKYLYCLETILFALWGRFNMVNAYIIFHHVTLPIGIWIGLNYIPAGIGVFPMFVNLATHAFLLTFLSAIAICPKLKRPWAGSFSLWLHVIQFSTIGIFWAQLSFSWDCDYHWFFKVYGCLWGILLGYFFMTSFPSFQIREIKHDEYEDDQENDKMEFQAMNILHSV